MTKGKGKNVWLVILILSCLFLAWTIFAMSDPGSILETGLHKYAGSSFDVAELDKAGRGFLEMSMINPYGKDFGLSYSGYF